MSEPQAPGGLAMLAVRGAIGGTLMGLANLVPGISGGTMLLAAGVYTLFIEGVAELTTFRFRVRSMVVLGSIAIAAGLAIALLAGPVKSLVTTHRWIMYSLFIGLTFGGVPLVWRMARPATAAVAGGAATGFGAMALMAIARGGAAAAAGFVMLVVAGIAGASAMILPGVSGAYLLLVLGQYETILGAVDQLKNGQLGALSVIVPVGIGVAVGIAGVSNLIRWALKQHPKPVLGGLLGLLFGSVLGIWPFQQAVEHGAPSVYFAPSAGQVFASLALVAAGFTATLLISRIGKVNE